MSTSSVRTSGSVPNTTGSGSPASHTSSSLPSEQVATFAELPIESMTTIQLCQRAQNLARRGRAILGIVGAPGAGKSTLARTLAKYLHQDAVCVGMDGFHLEDSLLARLGRRERKGAIDTFDDGGYASLMQRIKACEETVYAPRFDRTLENSLGSAVPVDPHVPLVITEGNYLLSESGSWPKARGVMDEVWFLAPSEQVRHARLIRRHQAYGKSLEQARKWALGSDEDNAQVIEATAGAADLIINWI